MSLFRIDAEIGIVWLVCKDGFLTGLRFGNVAGGSDFTAVAGQSSEDISAQDRALFFEARGQLAAYFSGSLKCFDLPVAAAGTPFQRDVWRALVTIPYGETRSYVDVARTLGKSGASRAVGSANGKNPLPIIVPCHRVIASDGSLAGYSGGADMKRKLLALEGVTIG